MSRQPSCLWHPEHTLHASILFIAASFSDSFSSLNFLQKKILSLCFSFSTDNASFIGILFLCDLSWSLLFVKFPFRFFRFLWLVHDFKMLQSFKDFLLFFQECEKHVEIVVLGDTITGLYHEHKSVLHKLRKCCSLWILLGYLYLFYFIYSGFIDGTSIS